MWALDVINSIDNIMIDNINFYKKYIVQFLVDILDDKKRKIDFNFH